MSTQKNKSILSGASEEVLLATELLAEDPKPSGNATDESAQLRAMLLRLLGNKLQEEENEKRMKEEEARRLLIARTQDFKINQERRDATQAACPHLKENGKPNIGGQELSSGDVLFICQLCYKTFNQDTLPRHLAIDPNRIGG
jgi:hypothetical protein